MQIYQVRLNSIFIDKPGVRQKQPPVLTPSSRRSERGTELADFERETRGSVRRMLDRKSEFHRGLGQSFEKLSNIRAAIRAYEHAKHYAPADMTPVKEALELRTNFFRELRA
jgi:hypothetical protein